MLILTTIKPLAGRGGAAGNTIRCTPLATSHSAAKIGCKPNVPPATRLKLISTAQTVKQAKSVILQVTSFFTRNHSSQRRTYVQGSLRGVRRPCHSLKT